MACAILSFIFLILNMHTSRKVKEHLFVGCISQAASHKVLCKATDKKYTGRQDKVHNNSNNNSDPVHGRLHECTYRYVCSVCAHVCLSVCLLVPPFNYATESQNLRFDAPVCMLMQLHYRKQEKTGSLLGFFFDNVSWLVGSVDPWSHCSQPRVVQHVPP